MSRIVLLSSRLTLARHVFRAAPFTSLQHGAYRSFHPTSRSPYPVVDIVVPEMPESLSDGTLKQWSKKVGDAVEADDEVTTIETDKIDLAVNAPSAGVITEILAKEEDVVRVGQVIGKIDTDAKAGSSSKSEPSKSQPSKPSESSPEPTGKSSHESAPKLSSSPSPKQPSSSSSPPASRQSSSPASEQSQQQPAQPASKPPTSSSSTNQQLWSRAERRVKMNRMRLRIGERLKEAQNTSASLTTFQEVDMSSLIEFRTKYKEEYLKKTGIKIGFMGAFARAATLAMKDIPSINAAIVDDNIVYHDYVDISVAVATEKGLTTPVVRNVESMTILDIERVISELGKKARDNKLTIEDMAGGTFTISNGGVFGSLMSTPIINPPQSAVLGLHAIFPRVVSVDGKFETRPIMNLALTYDHRLIDGREAATFLVKIKEFIQDPRKMLLA